MKKYYCLLLIFLFACTRPHQNLRNKIGYLAQAANGTVGIFIEQLESGDTLSFNGSYHCPMQSVFKFPIALAVLDRVDKGKFSLSDKIHLSKADVADTLTWSPMRDTYPKGDTDITLDEMLHFMVANSDNIACDIMLKKLGGTKVVDDFIHGLAINGISIQKTEMQMHTEGWDAQYSNWCEPNEMNHLLEIFYTGKCLSPSSTAYLRKVMEGTTTCPKRLKGLLPEGTVVARKSGTSGTNNGLTAATNDVGVITMPDGKHLIISAFISDSKADDTTRDAVIARITKAAYDEFLKN